MVVQLILASRMGTRELESDEEDENAFEVSREHLTKFIGKAPPTKSQLQEAIEKAAIDAKNPKPEQSNDKPKDEPVKTEETDNNEKKAEIEEPKVEKKTENEEPKETEKNDNDKETKAENPEKTEENKVEQVRTPKKIVKFQKHYFLTKKKNREFLLTFFRQNNS